MPSSGGQTCARSEEHTSELQSHDNLVCRLLLEKKKNNVDSFSHRSSLHTHTLYYLTYVPRRASRLTVRVVHLVSTTLVCHCLLVFFFFNDPAPPEFSPFSLPAPLPI